MESSGATYQKIIKDEDTVELMCARLKDAVCQIQNKNTSDLSFEEIYRYAFLMVYKQGSERLYNDLRATIEEHLVENVRKDVLESLHNNLLSKLSHIWVDYQTALKLICAIFAYMDRVFIARNKGYESVYNLGLIAFGDKIIRYSEIQNSLSDILLNLIKDERDGKVVDRAAIKNACQMLMTLSVSSVSVYKDVFEQEFLDQSTLFYKLESQKLFAENDVNNYIKTTAARIQEETGRASFCFDKSTEKSIVNIVEDELLKKHLHAIVAMEKCTVGHMIKNKMTKDLACMHKLFSRLEPEGIKVAIDTISSYFRAYGRSLVGDVAVGKMNAVTLVQNLINIKDEMDALLKYSFKRNKTIKKALLSDLEYIMHFNAKSPEHLSLFIDDKMKKGGKEMEEEEIATVLDKTIDLILLLKETDVFEAHYKRHLSKRLLLRKSDCEDFERIMISKLTIACGHDFTRHFQRMLEDLTLSTSINAEFNSYINKDSISLGDVDLTVDVLTSGFWPTTTSSRINCNIAPEPWKAFEIFRNFFLKTRARRKLTLQPQMGSAFISGEFYGSEAESHRYESEAVLKTKRRYILITSTYQMCILMLFNDYKVMSCEEIQKKTDLPESELHAALQSLSMGKLSQRILVRKSKTNLKDIAATDKFFVNDEFSSKFYRVRIQTVVAKENSQSERKKINDNLNLQRKYEIDAAIVRIMKTRRSMDHNLLISELISQLKSRFAPSPVMIKKQIEVLIDKEYIARDTDNLKRYIYIA
uniref:Cullin family profile domain-containing protein n=1 Tax=Glossina morsitans morsitans TaxID=37546 RepID=A0A1B0FH51_GLOMM